jgi:hypothetical protein
MASITTISKDPVSYSHQQEEHDGPEGRPSSNTSSSMPQVHVPYLTLLLLVSSASVSCPYM